MKAKNEYAPALAAAATWCRPVTLANGGPPEPVRRSGVPDVESVSLTVQRSPAMCFSGSGPAAAPAWSTEQAAIVGRGPIEQAKGLLAERYQITPDAARDL